MVVAPDQLELARSRQHLANVLRTLDRADEALPIAELAWARHQRDDIRASGRAGTAFVLAHILWDIQPPARDRPRARRLAEDARVSYEKSHYVDDKQREEVQRWLDTHRIHSSMPRDASL